MLVEVVGEFFESRPSMSDYTELVKALRYCTCNPYKPCDECGMSDVQYCVDVMHKDAAAAIEALEADNAAIQGELDALRVFTNEAQNRIEELQAQLMSATDAAKEIAKKVPKRGKWIRVGDCTRKCSACGELSCCDASYCPDCGAKMEVQDG